MRLRTATLGRASTYDQLAGRILIDPSSPNPVHTSASIGFTVPNAGRYEIGMFDVNGRAVRGLLAGDDGARIADDHLGCPG